jgi:NTE family protein
MKKYALVLGGGGAKGSYQAGVWEVLKKMGIKFEAIIGTSVGSLNGALIAQNAFKECIKLWENLRLNDIVSIPEELINEKDVRIKKNTFNYITFLQKKIFEDKGLDTNPLRNLLNSCIDEKKIRKSKIDFGLITYDISSLKPLEIFLDRIPSGEMINYLLASSGIPGFKATEIDGKTFLDGGVYDNVPFSLAKGRGYKRIIVVDVSGIGVTKKPEIEGTEVIYIKNSVDLGAILDFNSENAKRNMEIGRLDTLKVFNKVSGIKYFYLEDKKIIQKLTGILFEENNMFFYRKFFELKNVNDSANLENKFRSILPEKIRNHKKIIIPFIECAARVLEVEVVKLYKFEEFLFEIKLKLDEVEANNEKYDEDGVIGNLKKIHPVDIFSNISFPLPKDLLIKNENPIFLKAVSAVFPELIPAKIFFHVLKKYF